MALRLILENPSKDIALIHVRGAIDLATLHAWEDTIRRVIRRRPAAVIVEVAKLEHISARGLKMLLALAANQSITNGGLIVVGARVPIRRAAKIVGLWDMACEATSIRSALQKGEGYRDVRNSTCDLMPASNPLTKQMSQHGGSS